MDQQRPLLVNPIQGKFRAGGGTGGGAGVLAEAGKIAGG